MLDRSLLGKVLDSFTINAGCSKRLLFSPARPQRAETRCCAG